MPARKSRVNEKYKIIQFKAPIEDESIVKEELGMSLAEFARRAWALAMANQDMLPQTDEAEAEFQRLSTHNGAGKSAVEQFASANAAKNNSDDDLSDEFSLD